MKNKLPLTGNLGINGVGPVTTRHLVQNLFKVREGVVSEFTSFETGLIRLLEGDR